MSAPPWKLAGGGAGLSEAVFLDAESRLGCKLPLSLRELYTRQDGGSPEACLLHTAGSTLLVADVLTLSEVVSTTLDLRTSLPEFFRRSLPFAVDGTGDYYVVTESGRVGIVRTETNRPYLDDLAASLAEFVAALVPEES